MSVYILKRLGGLGSIKNMTPPQAHYSNTPPTDKSTSEHSEFYKHAHLPGATHGLHLFWDGLQDKFFFDGSEEELDEIVKQLRKPYPKDHPDYGKVIEKANKYDKNDPFFTHDSFYNKYIAQDGEILLDDSIPEQRLFVKSYKENRKVIDKSREHNYTFSAEWEIISPNLEDKKEAENNDKLLDAFALLAEMKPETIKIIATILNVDADFKSIDSIKNKTIKALKENRNVKAYNMSFVDKFVELAASGTENLMAIYYVAEGLKQGILTFNNSYYQFRSPNSEALTSINVRSVPELHSYFKKESKQMQILIADVNNRLSDEG
jgi:hypothetical protein